MKTQLAIVTLLGLVASAGACGGREVASATVDSVAYAPDGTLVVFTNGGLFLFDAQLDEKSGIALGGLPGFSEPGQYKYSLSGDGTVAAVAYSSGTSDVAPIALDLYRVPSGEVSRHFQLTSPPPAPTGNLLTALSLSPHGDRVAAVLANNTDEQLTMIDAATGAVIWTAAPGDKALAGWSSDGATLYTVTWMAAGSILEAYDAGAGLKWSRQLSSVVDRMTVTADGATLAGFSHASSCTTSCLEQVSTWSAADGTELAQVDLPSGVFPAGGPYGGIGNGAFACSATDDACAAQLSQSAGLTDTYAVQVYRSDGTNVVTLSPLPPFVASVALSPDGQLVAVSMGAPSWGSGANAVELYRLSDGAQAASHSFDYMP